jgi:hypothetical protein
LASSIFDGEGINSADFAYSIMQLETKLYRHIKFGEDLGDIDYFTIDSLLKNWIFGLYEILRSFRENEWSMLGGKISINGGDTIIEDVKTPSILTYAR